MAPVRLAKSRVSYADLQAMPEDGRRYELYDGELVVVLAPLPRHQVVADNIGQILRAHARATGGVALTSPLDIVFTDYTVLQPDVVFFGPARRSSITLDEPIRAAPDIAVEVLSPSTEARDRGKKMRAFARFGVSEYWIVDPVGETIEIHQLAKQRYRLAHTCTAGETLRSPTVTGLQFPAAAAFEGF